MVPFAVKPKDSNLLSFFCHKNLFTQRLKDECMHVLILTCKARRSFNIKGNIPNITGMNKKKTTRLVVGVCRQIRTNRVCLHFFMACTMNVDFHYRHSLSAGGQGASSACACGVSLDALFPQESRTFLSNQLCYNI